MPSENRGKGDVEIIPPDRSEQQKRARVHIVFGAGGSAYRTLPLHQRIIHALALFVGALVFGLIVVLVLASTILIWIPLILAAAAIITLVAIIRARFLRRS